MPTKRRTPITIRAAILTVIGGGVFVVLGSIITPLIQHWIDQLPIDSTSLPSLLPTPTPSQTPIPPGNLFLSIDFNDKSDGYCNDYDLNILGYEIHKYYIQPLSPAGYISHCQSGVWNSIGSLEVEAYPTGDKSVFGYGVLLGWKGNEAGTTDMCIFGIKRSYKVVSNNGTSEYHSYTQVMTHQRIGGKTIYPDEAQYLDYTIDDNPHVIRMVMLDENTMLGYLDDVLIANYSFSECGEGGIGLVAWGTGKTRVYFDNLKLYGLP